MNNPFEIIKKYNLKNPKTLVQIGASGGQELHDFINAGVTEALLIEPLDFPFSVLQHQLEGIPSYVPVKALISSINGKKYDFYIASNGGQSSSILEPNEHLSKFPFVSFDEKIELISCRLDTLFLYLKNENIIKFDKIDMLFMDVQGAELFVLQGAGEILDTVNYIWTEVGIGNQYLGAAAYIDIIQFLHLYGFQLLAFDCEPHAFGNALFYKS